MSEEPITIGTYVTIEGEPYVIATGDEYGQITLVCLTDGCVWANVTRVNDPKDITIEELNDYIVWEYDTDDPAEYRIIDAITAVKIMNSIL